VTLDGQPAVSDDGQGNSQWGMHQPATNEELHFAVTPASQMAAGVFPVCPITNTTYTYDAAGQLTSQVPLNKGGTGVVSYAYDAARNLTRCWSGTTFTNFYQYDHARRLICQVTLKNGTIESNRFIYEGMDVIAKVDEISGEVVYFTRGLGIAPGVGDVLAETHILGTTNVTYVYVQDHRGDTIALVSNSTVVARYEYSAWGVPEPLNPEPSPFFGFSGKHYDSDAGLYYYGFRWYDPQAKRWTQPDPSGLAEGLDLYQFCGNDPINWVDVWGCRGIITIYSIEAHGYHKWHGSDLNVGEHAWIIYEDIETHKVFIWSIYPTHGLVDWVDENRRLRPYAIAPDIRTALVDSKQEAALFAYIEQTRELKEKAYSIWSACSSFAANAWRVTTGEALDDRQYLAFGYSDPNVLSESIRKANQNTLDAFRQAFINSQNVHVNYPQYSP